MLLPGLSGLAKVQAQAGGFWVEDTLLHDGLLRDYLIYVPNSYDGSEPVPLVLNLHGAGSNANEQAFYSRLTSVADTAGFLMIIPNAVDNFWNSGFSFIPAGAPDDVGFLLSLVDDIAENYSIDEDRIYSTGMSNGGFMSYRLACEHPDRIAAIASVTGSMADLVYAACDPSRVVPVMQVHGTADVTVPYEGGLASIAIPTVVEFWRAHNDCPELPEVTDIPSAGGTGCPVQKQRYFPCQDWSEVLLYRVENGGHTWPGAFPLPDAGCTNQDVLAHVELWLFFRRHRLSNRFTGLPSTTAASTFSIWPNPVSHTLRVSSAQDAVYSVTDISGRVLYSAEHPAGEWELNTGQWSAGLYLLLSSSGERHRFSVVR